MTVIELPDDQAAVLKAKAAAQGLTLEDWFKQLAGPDISAPPTAAPGSLDAMFAKIRGLADDIDFSRNPSTTRPLEL
ncbi:MAG: hypothetical protein M3Y27_14605 [Acidobacteriota bacterium]|nr:hypothetical protein [Acidobacteriota bacterium]